MATSSNTPESELDARTLRFERSFNAPRELVWQAWTDPAHVGNWWGPAGFSTTTQSIEVRSGGLWRFVMHGPDGTDYKNLIEFIEVIQPERLVYAQRGEDETADISFHTTLVFAAQGNTTHLTLQMVFPSVEVLRRVVDEFGAVEGAHQHLARLAEYLESMKQRSTT